MANMSAKSDQEAHNGLVAIMFTSLFPYMSIVTLTFDLQNHQSLCRDWSSTGLFLFDNLQMFKSEISSEHDDLQGRYCEQDFILL